MKQTPNLQTDLAMLLLDNTSEFLSPLIVLLYCRLYFYYADLCMFEFLRHKHTFVYVIYHYCMQNIMSIVVKIFVNDVWRGQPIRTLEWSGDVSNRQLCSCTKSCSANQIAGKSVIQLVACLRRDVIKTVTPGRARLGVLGLESRKEANMTTEKALLGD